MTSCILSVHMLCTCISVQHWLSLDLGLSAEVGAAPWRQSSGWLTKTPLFPLSLKPICRSRFIWTLLSLQSSQESYDQTCIPYALYIVDW